MNKASCEEEEEARVKKKKKKKKKKEEEEEEGSRGGEEGTWSKKNNFEAKHTHKHTRAYTNTHKHKRARTACAAKTCHIPTHTQAHINTNTHTHFWTSLCLLVMTNKQTHTNTSTLTKMNNKSTHTSGFFALFAYLHIRKLPSSSTRPNLKQAKGGNDEATKREACWELHDDTSRLKRKAGQSSEQADGSVESKGRAAAAAAREQIKKRVRPEPQAASPGVQLARTKEARKASSWTSLDCSAWLGFQGRGEARQGEREKKQKAKRACRAAWEEEEEEEAMVMMMVVMLCSTRLICKP